MRTALTMLGIIIGVGAVITLSSLGAGVQDMVSSSFSSLGTNRLLVMPQQPEGSTDPVYLTMADAKALADPFNVPAASMVAPEIKADFRVTHDKESVTVGVAGTNPTMPDVASLELALGSFFADHDLDERARVAVLGWATYTTLFPGNSYPLGQSIIVDGTRFEVIGVLKAKGGMFWTGSLDEVIYVPITTAHARLYPARTLSGDEIISTVSVSAVNEDAAATAQTQVEQTLRRTHRLDSSDDDDFQVFSQQEAIETSGEITGVITTFLAIVAGISLLVGGIGIMNIMLVTVTERTREIGIRKAVGGTNDAVMAQFLIESLVLSLSGGLIGILLGWLGAGAISRLMGIVSVVSLQILAMATGISVLVGVVFGVYPAMRAARLNPIDALRYE
jgi:putative ABC transport system permease protein